jgi:CheY-like chemotaxis protein
VSAARAILVIEDGREYVEAFARLAAGAGDVELVRAADAEEALAALRTRRFDAVFLDVVFDRTPPERLAGDRALPANELARLQGFQILAAIAPQLPAGTRVVMAFDFSASPGRLETLRERVQGLEGLPEGAGASEALRRLLR